MFAWRIRRKASESLALAVLALCQHLHEAFTRTCKTRDSHLEDLRRLICKEENEMQENMPLGLSCAFCQIA